MSRFAARKWFRSSRRDKPQTVQRSSRLRLEELENRLAPATFTWNDFGASANTNFNNGANWVGGIAPTGNASALEDLVFPAGTGIVTTPTNNIAGAVFNSITFQGNGYTVSGFPMTLGVTTSPGSGRVIVNTNVTGETISANLVLGGPPGSKQFFIVQSGGSLTLSGQLSGTTGSELTKQGQGMLVLSNDNSGFIGPITVDTDGGVLQISNANALGNTAASTTVRAGGQIQVNNVLGSIAENVTVNGTGFANDGALLNLAGANTWSGAVTMDSDTTLGSTAGTLNITGRLSDLGSGHNLTKAGAGTVALSNNNTYRGSTTVIGGVLEARSAGALGTADGTTNTGTTVSAGGTLATNDPNGIGFTIANELLQLNGAGTGGTGALENISGFNTWTGAVRLISNSTINTLPSTTAPVSSLTITGVVSDPGGARNLTKTGTGTLILAAANTYRGTTTIQAGILGIRDSQGLGAFAANQGTTVQSGATLELGIDALADSVTGNTSGLLVKEPLRISGTGSINQGALDSSSGINVVAASITLAATAAIGVEPDPSPSTTNNYFTDDYSLTVTTVGLNIGQIIGTGSDAQGRNTSQLDKVGDGQLILPNANLSFTGPVDIQAGWITIGNNNSLGTTVGGAQAVQPTVTVELNAALHLKPKVGNLTIPQNFVLTGMGITHPFVSTATAGGIDDLGAIANLLGINTIPGNILLLGQVGIGVEQVFGPSQLYLTGFIGESLPVINVSGSASGGTQEDDNVIDTGGLAGTITLMGDAFSVPDDFRIYLGDYVTSPATAINVYDSTTNGQPQNPTSNGTATVTVNYTNTQAIATAVLTGGANWTLGPVVTNYPSLPSTFVTIVVNQGGGLSGTVWDYTATIVPFATTGGGGITKLGSKLLDIRASGNYTGPVDIKQGVLLAQNNTALGAGTAPTSITTVESGAALLLSDGIQIPTAGGSNEQLILNGPGNTSLGATYDLTGGPPLAPLTVLSDATIPNLVGATDVIVPTTNNVWNGPVTLNTSVAIEIEPGSRLSLLGTIDDATNNALTGSDLVKVNTGELVLGGANTYRGVTYVGTSATDDPDIGGATVNEFFHSASPVVLAGSGGILTVTNSQGLGAPTPPPGTDPYQSGTIVQDGAALQLRGDLTIAGEALIIQGNGTISPGVVGVNILNNNGYVGLDFNQSTGFVPPDTNGAAGPSSFIETVNQALAIYNKSTGALVASADFATFFGSLPALAGGGFSDPVVVYDDNVPGQLATQGRFIVVDQMVDPNNGLSRLDFAVSKSPNPTTLTAADWFFFSIDNHEVNGGTNAWADYPGNLGYNKDALVVTFNMFDALSAGGAFENSQIVSVNINALINGNPLFRNNNYFIQDRPDFALRPTVMHDAAAGAPMWFVAEGAAANTISVLKMTNVLSPASTFTNFNLGVNAYSPVVPPLNPDGSVITSAIDSRILKAAEANSVIVAAHSVAVAANQDVARWYEISVAGATPLLIDQGNVSAGPDTYIVYPGVDINAAGAIGMTYMRSGTDTPTDFMSMWITGRAPTDPAGLMETPIIVSAGTGLANYSDFAGGREGDLSGINVDPNNGSFWAVNEFATSAASENWSTAIANFTVGPQGAGPVGALHALSGSSIWTGPVYLAKDSTISASAGAQLNIIGQISDWIGTTDNKLTKDGAGTLTLSGDNNYSGLTDIVNGVLIANNPHALGLPTGPTIVRSNAALWIESDLELEPVTLNGDGIQAGGHNTGALRNISNFNTYTGPLTLNTNTTIGVDSGSQLTIGVKPTLLGIGAITDNGNKRNLVKELTGTLVLGTANTYGNPAGTFTIANYPPPPPNPPTLFAGGTVVAQGILNIQDGDALGTFGNAGTTTTVLDGAQLQLQGGITVGTEKLRLSGTGVSDSGALESVGGLNTWQGLIILAQDGGFLPATTAPANVAIGALLSDSADQLVLAGVLDDGARTLGIDKVGPGTVVLSNSNTYDGVTTVSAGALRIQNNGALGNTPSGTVVSTGAALELDGDPLGFGSNLSILVESLGLNGAGAPELQTVAVIGSGTFTLTFKGDTTALLSDTSSAAVIQAELDALPSIGGVGASVTVTQSGNTYLIAFGGTLSGTNVPQLTAATTGPTIVINTFRDGAAGALRNVSGNNSWTGSVTLQTSSSIGVDPATQLTLVGNVGNTVPAAVPAPDLTKSGAGTLVFPNANTYTGATFINQGVLNIRNPGSLGAVVNEVQRVDLSGPLSGTFTLTFNGQTTNPLSANYTGTNPNFIANIQAEFDNMLGTGSVTVAPAPGSPNAFTVTFNGGAFAGADQPQMTGAGSTGVGVAITTTRDGAKGTFVAPGATLQVQGDIIVSTESLILNGSGFNGAGALENVLGNNSWRGPILLNGDSAIGVDSPGDTLFLDTGIVDNGNFFGVTKTGPGTLQYDDNPNPAVDSNNYYSGLTSVQEGILLLGKAPDEFNFEGDLTIGNAGFFSGPDTSVVRFLDDDQIQPFSLVQVHPDGLLDLNNFSDTINSIFLLGDPTQAAHVSLADGTLSNSFLFIFDGLVDLNDGRLDLVDLHMEGGQINLQGALGNVVLDASGGTLQAHASDQSAVIGGAGYVDLNGLDRTFDVTDGPAPNPLTDLRIDAAIVDFIGGAGLIKDGDGVMEINSDANAYLGLTRVNAGKLLVNGTIGGNVELDGGTLGGEDGAGAGTVGDITVGGGPLAVVTITNGGSGYTSPPTVTISGGGGSGATAVATISGGVVTGITLTNRGSNYTSAPTLTFSAAPPGGRTATGSAGLGVVSPGDNNPINGSAPYFFPGTLHSTGNVTLGSATFFVDLYDGIGPVNDLLYALGNVNITGATLAGLVEPSKVVVGDTFTIIKAANQVTGRFQNDFIDPADSKHYVYIDNKKFEIQTNVFDIGAGTYDVILKRVLNRVTLVLPTVSTAFYGQNLSYTVTLVPEIGTIPNGTQVSFTFTAGPGTLPTTFNATVTNHQATFNPFTDKGYILLPTPPAYVLHVSFPGVANNYLPAATGDPGQPADLVQNVNKANTAFSDAGGASRVSATPNPAVYGTTVNLNAHVSVLAPGGQIPGTASLTSHTVTFFVDNVSVATVPVNAAGNATYPITGLVVGSHLVRATLSGDSLVSGASTNIDYNLSITKASTTTTVAATPNPQSPGQNVHFTVHVASTAGVPTGSVVLKDGNATFATLTINGSGDASADISTLASGVHSITAQYTGDTNYQTSTSSPALSLTIKGRTSVTVAGNPNPSVVGNTVVYTATVTRTDILPAALTGTVEFYYDGTNLLGSSSVNASGIATWSSSLVPFGTHTIDVHYLGDGVGGSYVPSQGSANQVVKGTTNLTVTPTPSPSTFSQTVTFAVSVAATTPSWGTPTGDVQFFEGSNLLGTRTLSGGSASFSISTFSVAQHNITVFYVGDANFASNTRVVTQTVKSNTTVQVSSSGNLSTYGQQVTFTATVLPASAASSGVGGSVNLIIDNGAPINIAVVGGVATYQTSTLSASANPHTIVANYLGDTLFNPSSGALAGGQLVNPANTTTAPVTATVGGNSAASAFFGQQIVFRTTIAAVAPGVGPVIGTVTFDFDGTRQEIVTLTAANNGVATLPLTDLAAGAHQVRATYNSNGNFSTSNSNSTPLSFQVSQTATTMGLVANPANSTYGVAAVAATVTPVSPGGGVPNGNVIFALTNLSTNVTTNVTVALNGSGVANLPPQPVGSYRVSASYAANANYGGSSAGPANFSVAANATTLSLVSSAPGSALYGQAVITATVTPAVVGVIAPSGTVVFTILDTVNNFSSNRTAALVNGVATLPLPPLDVGVYQISANYTGDNPGAPNFLPSGGGPIAQTVTKADSAITIGSSPSPSFFGQSTTFTITLAAVNPGGGTPTGTISIQVDGGASFVRQLVAGQATFNTNTLAAGGHTVLVTYAGDNNFKSSQQSYSHTVNAANTTTNVLASSGTLFFGQNVTFTALVTANGPAVGTPTGSVNFIIDSGAAINRPLQNGQATFSTSTLAVGNHTVQVDYLPDTTNYLTSTGNLTPLEQVRKGNTLTGLSSSANPSAINANVTFTATVSAVAPAQGTIGGNVEFVIDGGSPISVPVTGGQAQTTVAFSTQGTHNVVANYLGDGHFNSSSNSLVQSVKSATTASVVSAPSPSFFSQDVTFTATVALSGPGSGVPSGNVQFVIDGGVPLTRPLAGGQATLTINTLSVAAHSVVVNYLGDGNFFPSSNSGSPYSHTVLQGTTHTSLTLSPASSVIGQSVLVSATVTPDNPSTAFPVGAVSFVDLNTDTSVSTPLGSFPLNSNGVASVAVSSFTLGHHTITATFNSTTSYAGSSDAKSELVSAADTNVTLGSSLNPSVVTQLVTITATVNVTAPGSSANVTPTGTVAFVDLTTSTNLGTFPVVGGQAQVSTSALAVGSHTIQATFTSTSNNFNSSAAASIVQTVKVNPVVFAVLPTGVKSGAGFTVVVQYRNNGVVDTTFNGPVTLAVASAPAGGSVSGALTVNAVQGVATFTGLKAGRAGAYRFSATANGAPAVLSAPFNVTANVLAATLNNQAVINAPIKVTFKALDATGQPAPNFTGAFTLQIISKPLGATVTGRAGTFVGGIANLSNLAVNKVGTYRFRLTLNGLSVDLVIAVRGRRAV